jgi:ribosomal protein S27E
MVHCPDCGETLEKMDVEFVDFGTVSEGWLSADAETYGVICNHCGAMLGGGVAKRSG